MQGKASQIRQSAALGAKSLAALGVAAAVSGCNPLGYPDCFRVRCPYPPVYNASYAGYVPAYVDGRPAFGEPPFDNPFAQYTQRSMTINPTVGNAQDANTVLQTATPWPRYSSNTNIPGDGSRMVKAVQNFESGSSASPLFGPPLPPPIQANPFTTTGGGGSSGGGSSGGGSSGY